MYVSYSDITVRNCRFVGNTAGVSGAGLGVSHCAPRVEDCVFIGNFSYATGGGLYSLNGEPVIAGCLFTGNGAATGGAAISLFGSNVVIESSTVAENGTGGGQGAIRCYESSPSVGRTIVAFNDAGGAFYCSDGSGSSDPVLVCSDLYGNVGGDYTGCVSSFEETDGNFSSDPLFCTVVGAADDPYGLDAESPCAEANQPLCGRVGARPVACAVVSVDAGEDAPPPTAFRLHANRPNPFNPVTVIRFDMPRPGRARLSVYDVRGRRVAVLAEGRYDAGAFEARWTGLDSSGRAVASGIYFALFEAEDFRATRKMVLLR